MSEKIETGGPAFPCHPEIIPHRDHDFAGMTLRQYAAIKLRVPNSGTDWLDEMIHQSLRDELAAKAMQGLISNDQDYEVWGDWIENGFEDRQSIVNVYAEAAYEIAGALLKAQKAPQ